MKFVHVVIAGWMYLCLATAIAEMAVVAVLAHRGQFSRQTIQNLLTIAYDIPVREMYDRAKAKAQPVKKEMISFAEVRDARMLAGLNLDLRELAADKGLIDLRELDLLVEQEKERYTRMKDHFDRRWDSLSKDATNTSLQEVRRQIESVQPTLAKDQLLRILDDKQMDPDVAFHHVVTIFKSMPIDKRKKIVAEFGIDKAPQLRDILREIRLGMPQSALIREAREQLNQFRNRN